MYNLNMHRIEICTKVMAANLFHLLHGDEYSIVNIFKTENCDKRQNNS